MFSFKEGVTFFQKNFRSNKTHEKTVHFQTKPPFTTSTGIVGKGEPNKGGRLRIKTTSVGRRRRRSARIGPHKDPKGQMIMYYEKRRVTYPEHCAQTLDVAVIERQINSLAQSGLNSRTFSVMDRGTVKAAPVALAASSTVDKDHSASGKPIASPPLVSNVGQDNAQNMAYMDFVLATSISNNVQQRATTGNTKLRCSPASEVARRSIFTIAYNQVSNREHITSSSSGSSSSCEQQHCFVP